jgi:hypothetical protein
VCRGPPSTSVAILHERRVKPDDPTQQRAAAAACSSAASVVTIRFAGAQ